jgi:uncharacterized heparinase superfamily protein
MSGVRGALERAARLPTIWRTVSHLQGAQAWAQLRHTLLGPPRPREAPGPPPALAVRAPSTPFLPPPAHVRADQAGRIELLGIPFDVAGDIDWTTSRHGPLFAYHLHQHEYLRLPAFRPVRRAECLTSWIHAQPGGIGWDPHPISLRLLCWGKLLTTPGTLEADAPVREAMLRSMADQIETLAHGLEVRLQANHLLSNLIAVVFGGVLLEGSNGARWRGCAERLAGELDAQVHPDGGHEERSPMYHALLLEGVLDLLNVVRADPARVPAELPEMLAQTAGRMLDALDVYTHPDGAIALFADSAFDVAAPPVALRDYARRLGVDPPRTAGPRLLPQTGYLRLAAGAFDLIASVAGPAPAHQPGHAHCDALAFELSVGGDRLVTDTGLFEYLPGPRRDHARSTAAHATLQLDEREQAEIWAAHRVGGRPEVALSAWDAEGSAEAGCRPWWRGAPLHRRRFEVGTEGVAIVDRVEGPTRSVRTLLPLDPDWDVRLGPHRALATRRADGAEARRADGAEARRADGAEARRADGAEAQRVEIELSPVFHWTLERDAYYPRFGCEVERFVLVGRATACDEAVVRFRRIGGAPAPQSPAGGDEISASSPASSSTSTPS